jgi:hypothetical protein
MKSGLNYVLVLLATVLITATPHDVFAEGQNPSW